MANVPLKFLFELRTSNNKVSGKDSAKKRYTVVSY